jgi:CheY-like chemotaxis protein
MSMPFPVQAVILLADDQENDVLLTKQALQQAQVFNPIYVVRDGVEAVQYLEGTGKFNNRCEYPLPDLLLLDVKMPRMDGFGVLRWLRSHSTLRTLRTVVQSSSELPQDVDKAHELGANAYIVKSGDFHSYCAAMRITMSFWLQIARYPSLHRLAGQCHGDQRGSQG